MNRAWGVILLALAACGRDNGPTVAVLQSPAGDAEAADPALGIDPANGDWLMSWVAEGALWFARSSDSGATWSARARVSDVPNDVHPHGESSPRLAVSPRGVLAAVWTNSVDVPNRRWPASNIRFARSTDGGKRWSHTLTLNDDTAATPGGHIFHGAAWSGDSTLLVTWLDERGGATPGDSADQGGHPGHHPESEAEPDARVYLARSTDNGARWVANQPLWGAACPCCRVSLARGPDGTVLAAWRKHFPGSVRDPVVAPVPVGRTTPAEIRVAVDGWVYPGCPHTGPGVTTDARGVTHIAWYVGKPNAAGVFYARTARVGADAFSKPVAIVSANTMPTAHPRVAALPDGGAIVASDVDGAGKSVLVLARVTAGGGFAGRTEVSGTDGADHPDMLALADGSVLVAWAQRAGDKSSVRLARVH